MSLTADQKTTIRDLAIKRGIPAAFALGIIDKESSGRSTYAVKGEQLPAIRYEGHYLYRLLKDNTAIRSAAVKAGLAAKTAGVVKNPNNMASRYALLDRVIAFLTQHQINPDLAYQSISIGIGQVMGSHYERLGYRSAAQMWGSAAETFNNQAEQMLDFIASDKTGLKYAQDFEYKKFGIWYNGPKAPASYWTTLKKYVEGYLKDMPIANPYLTRIRALGFKDVMTFQSARGIKVDGIIGPITQEHIDLAEKERATAQKPPVTPTQVVTGAVAAGVTTVAAANPDATADIAGLVVPLIEPITKGITTIAPLGLPFVLVAVAVVVGVVVFNAWRNRK